MTVAARDGWEDTLAAVCSLVDMQDGARYLSLDGARQYYAEVRDAARMVDDRDLSAIADSYNRAVHAIDEVEGVAREDLSDDLAWIDAIKGIKTGELVGICIERGLIDERFRDGLPG